LSHIPNISDAEWEVMKVLWTRSPRSANEIIQALEHHSEWKPKTVRTLLNRLVQKQAAAFSQEGKVYAYYPLVSEEDCVRTETRFFLNRIYGGSFKPMLAYFLRETQLTAEEIGELRQILDDKSFEPAAR
jgi:BlaI family transcriptional regulator, penicillinase repressor